MHIIPIHNPKGRLLFLVLLIFYSPVLSACFPSSGKSLFYFVFILPLFRSCFCFRFSTRVCKHKQYMVEFFSFESFTKKWHQNIQFSGISIFLQHNFSKVYLPCCTQLQFSHFHSCAASIVTQSNFLNHSFVDGY